MIAARHMRLLVTKICGQVCLAATAALLALPMSSASAEPQKFVGEYTVTFLGLTVGKSSFVSTIDGDNYVVSGTVRSAGVGKLVDSISGSSEIAGSFSGESTRPKKFWTEYKSGKKNQLTTIAFSGGAVTKTVNDPPLKQRPDKVPLTEAHLRGVTDPISATLIKAKSPAEVCNRTLRIYDGELRADVKLFGPKVGPVPGYQTGGVTCSAKFTPVAGYRSKNYAMKYMRDRARISISFAPLGETGVYAPVKASVTTTMGPVTMIGRRIKE